MSAYDQLKENQRNASVPGPESRRPTAGRSAAGAPAEFPAFGEEARRHFESSSSPMRIFDLETLRYLAVNDAAVKFYGHSREEFLGLTVRDTRHPAEHDAFFAGLAEQTEYLRHRPPRRQVKKSGEVAVVETITQDILFAGRRARLSLTLDLTDRLRMNELLRQRQQEFESLAENLPDLVARYDTGRRFAYVNAAIEKLFGMGRSRFIGRTQRQAGLPDALAAVYDESLALVFRTASPHKVEFRIATADGERLFEALHVPERDASGKVVTVICVARDITDRKQQEQELLTHAVQQRDALVREVHHRIKNSLQGVAGLLRQKITKNPAVAAEIEETIGQLQSVALVYGLQETRPDGLLSLVTIMDAICSSAESLIGGRVERAFERKSWRPACVAGQEAVSVAFALNELVFNALKHQPADAGEKRAQVTLRESLHEAEIRIANQGRLPKGFDFAEGRAVGSGLRLVQTLLASPGGSIAFNGGRDRVEVVLKLRPPLLAERQSPAAR